MNTIENIYIYHDNSSLEDKLFNIKSDMLFIYQISDYKLYLYISKSY